MLMGPANVVVPLLLAAVGLAAVSLLTVTQFDVEGGKQRERR